MMQFGQAVGTACLTFAITNIDDAFVLITFFAESARNKRLTPLKITIGQYVGFTVIMIISMIGFGVSLVLPSEPIGFLGLLPIVLGFWKLFDLILPTESEESENTKTEGLKSILKVSIVTIMNGGDNIGTYIPLFSQANGPEIAVYVVVYYILLGVWCLIGFLIMKQKHIPSIAQKYVDILVPFLYMGLGVYIVVKSNSYPWSIEHIDNSLSENCGKAIIASMTAFLLLTSIFAMVWFKVTKLKRTVAATTGIETVENRHPFQASEIVESNANKPVLPNHMPKLQSTNITPTAKIESPT